MKKNLLTGVMVFTTVFCSSQANMVKNLNGFLGIGSINSPNQELVPIDDKVIFAAAVPGFGTEPCVSDGTDLGTKVLKDIAPGGWTTYPENFYYRSSNNKVYFSADRINQGTDYELFITDGTTAGTTLVHEFNTAGESEPDHMQSFGFQLFLASNTNNLGRELCYTNGTPLTTGCIDVRPGISGSYPKFLTVYNGNLYFSATSNTGRELYKSNGTQSGTGLLIDINSGTDSASPQHLTVYNNKLYFVADDGVNGRELWETDGTASGTQMVSDLYPGATGSEPADLTIYKNKLYFSANTPNYGREIFSMNLSNSILLHRDVFNGTGSGDPIRFIVHDNLLFFVATNGTSGHELWSTDGTILGVNLVKDINPNGGGAVDFLTPYNGNLYFAANDGTNGSELWMTDGTTSGTVMVEDINPGAAGSQPRSLAVAGDNLFFHADDGTHGRELWKYFDPALSTAEFELNNIIKLQPNPTQDYFTISTQLDIEDVTIFDINGKMVKKFYGLLDQYNIENLTAGLYFVNVFTDNRKETIKLMKL